MNFKTLLLALLLISPLFLFSQEKDQAAIDKDNQDFLEDTDSYDPLTPARAAFYSAVLPGLGQAYNKSYWKIPIVYTSLAIPAYYYVESSRLYNRFRTAFKQRAVGEIDEFNGVYSDESLEYAQEGYKRNRDGSLLFFIGFYALQILEASIHAHLLQFNITDKITFNPSLIRESDFSSKNHLGLSLNLNF